MSREQIRAARYLFESDDVEDERGGSEFYREVCARGRGVKRVNFPDRRRWRKRTESSVCFTIGNGKRDGVAGNVTTLQGYHTYPNRSLHPSTQQRQGRRNISIKNIVSSPYSRTTSSPFVSLLFLPLYSLLSFQTNHTRVRAQPDGTFICLPPTPVPSP